MAENFVTSNKSKEKDSHKLTTTYRLDNILLINDLEYWLKKQFMELYEQIMYRKYKKKTERKEQLKS